MEVIADLHIHSRYSRAVFKDMVREIIPEGVERVRKGGIFIKPGYDGVFGKVSI